MISLGKAKGIPCPNCNSEGLDDDQSKWISTSINDLLITKMLQCKNCGTTLELDMSNDGNAQVIDMLNDVQEKMDEYNRMYNSQQPK